MSINTNFYHTALEAAKTNASWISDKVSGHAGNAYAFAGEFLTRVRNAVAPFFGMLAQKTGEFLSAARASISTGASSVATHFNALPPEGKAFAGVLGIAAVIAGAVFAYKQQAPVVVV